MRKTLISSVVVFALAGGAYWLLSGHPLSTLTDKPISAGAPLDSLNGVVVRHNDGMSAVHGRNIVDGYNLGLKYQCVEFVKRYYFEHYHHRMPNSYGDAKDFFDLSITDGELNPDRALLQFTNASKSKPTIGDLLVLDGSVGNPYGHVAIISAAQDGEIEVIQQNTGSTRSDYDLDMIDGKWRIDSERVLGWLRMPSHVTR